MDSSLRTGGDTDATKGEKEREEVTREKFRGRGGKGRWFDGGRGFLRGDSPGGAELIRVRKGKGSKGGGVGGGSLGKKEGAEGAFLPEGRAGGGYGGNRKGSREPGEGQTAAFGGKRGERGGGGGVFPPWASEGGVDFMEGGIGVLGTGVEEEEEGLGLVPPGAQREKGAVWGEKR